MALDGQNKHASARFFRKNFKSRRIMGESFNFMKHAAIFDWDGVVVDSEYKHLLSWEMLAQKHGLTLPSNFVIDTFGRRNLEIIKDMYNWVETVEEAQAWSDEKEVYFRGILREQGVDPIPGVIETMKAFHAAGIPMAVGSSTPRENLVMQADMLGIAKMFAATVTMEDVKNGKPAPDVFLLGAERMGVTPENCVVFEDSVAGIEAAFNAGMRRVAVATTHDVDFWEKRGAENAEKRVDGIIKNFTGFGAPELEKIFS